MKSREKKEEKKEQILKVAEEIFAEKNFQGATLKDIADRMGMQKPALYYYFRSKEEMYHSLILDIYQQLEDRVREPVRGGKDLREKIGLLITHLVDFWADHPQFPRIITQEVLSRGTLVYTELIPKFWMPMFNEALSELGREATARQMEGIDLPLLLINIFGMSVFYFFIGPILARITGEDYGTPEKIANLKGQIAKLVFDGIGLEEGSEA